MVKKIKNICFLPKGKEHNPNIKEGNLVGIAIQTWRDYVWSSCGYLMVPNDPAAIQFLEEKKISQNYFFHLEAEMRVEDFTEDVISDEGKKLGTIGKKKVYVENPDWGRKVKLIYFTSMRYFVPKKVVKNENNLLHVEIEPMDFYEHGLIDKLIFTGEKINQYRNLVAENLGKEFKVSLHIFKDDPTQPIDTNNWGEKYEKIGLSEESNDRPEKTASELRKDLAEYYRKNDIKSTKLSEEDKELLDIVFNGGKKKKSDTFSERRDKQKYEQIKICIDSNDKKSLDYYELIGVSESELSKLKKWMEENNVEEIILEKKNVVLCKKRNDGESLQFGSEPVGSEEIPEHLRTKINGVDIGRFFEKIGKNSITLQELETNQPSNSEKTKNQNNFAWVPYLMVGGILVLIIFSFFMIRNKKIRKKSIKSKK